MLKVIEDIETYCESGPIDLGVVEVKKMKLEYAINYLHTQIMCGKFYTEPCPFQIDIHGDEDICMLDDPRADLWNNHHC